jgi:hypothetical protein
VVTRTHLSHRRPFHLYSTCIQIGAQIVSPAGVRHECITRRDYAFPDFRRLSVGSWSAQRLHRFHSPTSCGEQLRIRREENRIDLTRNRVARWRTIEPSLRDASEVVIADGSADHDIARIQRAIHCARCSSKQHCRWCKVVQEKRGDDRRVDLSHARPRRDNAISIDNAGRKNETLNT